MLRQAIEEAQREEIEHLPITTQPLDLENPGTPYEPLVPIGDPAPAPTPAPQSVLERGDITLEEFLSLEFEDVLLPYNLIEQ